STYLSLLKGLEQQIGRLSIVDQSKSRWADYTPLTSYSQDEASAKRAFVGDYVSKRRPGILLDIGCSSGAYSEFALQAGAE
ncbi:hypothetical protein, partial [Acinetobacter baumannii]|uniref:hypothetical protein n=1 Tax=Acinetobacter baumannii TaxID=470 RepID=UPI001C09DF27